MKRLNIHGFTLVEGLLITVIIAVIVGTAWYVRQTLKVAGKHESSAVLTTTTKPPKEPVTPPQPAPTPHASLTANWHSYTSPEGKYTVKYPLSWVTAANQSLCAPGLLLIGPDASNVGKCAADSGLGEVSVLSLSGDHRNDYSLGAAYYEKIESKDVTLSGKPAKRWSGIAQHQQDSPGLGGLQDGTKVVVYVAYANDKTYVLQYNQSPAAPQVLAEFELIVSDAFTIDE